MAACTCRLALALVAVSAHAQTFSGGVRGGIPFGANGYANYTVGPTVEFKPPVLPLRFVVDALYKNAEYLGGTASVWDIPLMIRLESPTPGLKPFLMGGGLIRRLSFLGGETQTGFTLGGGLRIGLPVIKITPEFRYSYVGAGSRRGADNMGEILIGITF
jgi:hypothetical protein